MSKTANRSFENLDELEEFLCQRCQTLLKQQDLIQGLTSFYWWSQIDNIITIALREIQSLLPPYPQI